MSEQLVKRYENSGCGYKGNLLSGDVCSACEPKMALTFEEQAILDKLRDLKTIARMTMSGLKKIESMRFDRINPDGVSIEGDWIRLNSKLDELRSRWSDLSKRLEDANERKWISLGHREPRS